MRQPITVKPHLCVRPKTPMVATTSSLEHNIVQTSGLFASRSGSAVRMKNERHQETRKGLIVYASSLACQLSLADPSPSGRVRYCRVRTYIDLCTLQL